MSDHAPRTPKYRHYKPKNLAVVRIDGRDIYLGPYGSKESIEKYWRIIAEWNLTGTVPAPQATKAPEPAELPLSVGELILAFWRHAEVYYRRADGTPTGDLESCDRSGCEEHFAPCRRGRRQRFCRPSCHQALRRVSTPTPSGADSRDSHREPEDLEPRGP